MFHILSASHFQKSSYCRTDIFLYSDFYSRLERKQGKPSPQMWLMPTKLHTHTRVIAAYISNCEYTYLSFLKTRKLCLGEAGGRKFSLPVIFQFRTGGIQERRSSKTGLRMNQISKPQTSHHWCLNVCISVSHKHTRCPTFDLLGSGHTAFIPLKDQREKLQMWLFGPLRLGQNH